MAKSSRRKTPAWQRPGSPIGRKGPRKKNPKYKRHQRESWSAADVRTLRELAGDNTPTGVISLKMGRTEAAIRGKAQEEAISLKPANRSPYNRRKSTRKSASATRRKSKTSSAGSKARSRAKAGGRGQSRSR
jgi:hypothetical protein